MAIAPSEQLETLEPKIDREHRDGVEIVHVAGEIDLHAADALGAALDGAARRSDLVVVDLSNVRFFDSTALGLVLQLRRRLLAVGGNLVLVVDGRESQRVFQITGLDRLLTLLPTLEESLSAVRV
jgi:anti-sigma B factor antagonist